MRTHASLCGYVLCSEQHFWSCVCVDTECLGLCVFQTASSTHVCLEQHFWSCVCFKQRHRQMCAQTNVSGIECRFQSASHSYDYNRSRRIPLVDIHMARR